MASQRWLFCKKCFRNQIVEDAYKSHGWFGGGHEGRDPGKDCWRTLWGCRRVAILGSFGRGAFAIHFVRPFLVLLVALALLAGRGAPSSASSTTTVVSVYAYQPWTETGIDMPAGATVGITASGVIKIAGSDPGKYPDGTTPGRTDPPIYPCVDIPPGPFVVESIACWAMMGRVGDGAPFAVGYGTTFTTITGGRLYLGVNDNVFGDNSGAWSATVTVTTINYEASVSPPINPDGSSSFKASRGVVPVKFDLTADWAPTCDLPPATIAVTRTSGADPGPITEDVYGSPADSGSDFRVSDCQYVYNVAASTLGAGTYEVDILIQGTVVGSATFQLK